jgi:nitrile hydratase accessory protein
MTVPEAESPSSELEAKLTAATALPRRNGELVFEEPWQSRAFGMAVGLHKAGVFTWEEFRQRLIARIGSWDASGSPEPYAYYHHWLAALEDTVVARGVTGRAALAARAAEIAARPPEAEHAHHHHHQHHG